MKRELPPCKNNHGEDIWFCTEAESMDYVAARELQERLIAARKAGHLTRDTILLLEHPPVFTLGRRGGRENLVVTEQFLHQKGIPVVAAERGGDITFHGPGQLIGYPIIDLHTRRFGLAEYVTALEEVMIRTSANWGIRAERSPVNRGVWVGSKKLGSVGIAVRRGISFHGFALNVNMALEPFSWINPCGLHGVQMTSLERELRGPVSMREVRTRIREYIEQVFEITLCPLDLTDVEQNGQKTRSGSCTSGLRTDKEQRMRGVDGMNTMELK